MSFLDQLLEKPKPPEELGVEAPPEAKVRHPEDDRISLGDGRHVEVYPYNAHFDKDASMFLPWFWKRLKDDGLLALYFPNDTEKSFATFSAMLSGAAQILVVALVDDVTNEATDTIGFASWTPMQIGLATVGNAGFIYLKAFWDQHITLAAGHRIEKMWFEDMTPKLDLAVGIIAKANILARRYLNRLGWRKSGELPGIQQYAGEVSDGEIWYTTRAQYEGRK